MHPLSKIPSYATDYLATFSPSVRPLLGFITLTLLQYRPRWNVADRRLDVVRDPLDEVAAVLVLHVQHLFIDLSHGHQTAEHRRHGQVAAMTRVTGRHHVLGVKHLLRQLGHRQSTVLLAATGCQRSESGHEEVHAREWHHVDCQFSQVGVQLQQNVSQCRSF